MENNTEHYAQYLLAEEEQLLSIVINSLAEEKERSTYYTANIIAIGNEQHQELVEGKIAVYHINRQENKLSDLQYGDTLIIKNKLVPFQEAVSSYHFDYASFMYNKGFLHQAFLYDNDIITRFSYQQDLPFIFKARLKIQDILEKHIHDLTTLSLMKAVVLNDKLTLNAELRNHFSKTGIAHIIAISGMHVAIVCGFILYFIPKVKRQGIKITLYAFALVLVWFYIYLTDFPASAIRAAMMFSLGVASYFLNRKSISINHLLLTGLLMLIIQPHWIWDIGFQLSFLAVLSILVFNASIQKWYQPKGYIKEYIWSIISVSLSVQILVFPLVLYYFHNFPILVLFANIPAVIYSFLLLSGSFLLIVLDFISPLLSQGIGYILSFITYYFYNSIQFFSEISPSFFQELYINQWQLILLYLILLSMIVYYQKPHFYSKLGIVSMVILLCGQMIYAIEKQYHDNFIYIAKQQRETYIFIKDGNKAYYFSTDNVISDKHFQYQILPFIKAYYLKEVEHYKLDNWSQIQLSSTILLNEVLPEKFEEHLNYLYLAIHHSKAIESERYPINHYVLKQNYKASTMIEKPKDNVHYLENNHIILPY